MRKIGPLVLVILPLAVCSFASKDSFAQRQGAEGPAAATATGSTAGADGPAAAAVPATTAGTRPAKAAAKVMPRPRSVPPLPRSIMPRRKGRPRKDGPSRSADMSGAMSPSRTGQG